MSILFPVRRALSTPFGIPLGVNRAEFVRMTSSAFRRRMQCRLHLSDDLTRIAAKYPTDKGETFFPFHGYTRHYHKFFSVFRDDPITILEIGLARKRDRAGGRVRCPSLEMWAEYFPRATIVGFDIDDFSAVSLPRTRIFRGDQGQPTDLLAMAEECGKFGIVIDDGSHASFHQQTSLRTLWQHVAPGGIYAIEDLDAQPSDLESSLPACLKTRAFLRDLPTLNERIDNVEAVHLLDSPLRGTAETLGIIVKAR